MVFFSAIKHLISHQAHGKSQAKLTKDGGSRMKQEQVPGKMGQFAQSGPVDQMEPAWILVCPQLVFCITVYEGAWFGEILFLSFRISAVAI